MIFLIFVYIKTFRKRIGFCIYEWKLQWLPSAKNKTHVFYTQKAKQLWIVLIYKKPDTFQKTRQFPLRFYIQKARHFMLRDFSWNFQSCHLYTKSMTLCVMWSFIYKKHDTLQKSVQIIIRFLYTKIRHFALRDFSLNFWNLRRGVHIYS